MKRVIIVHRWSGGANDDWRPWLKTELEKTGCEVLVPDMPDPHVPVIEKWVDHLTKIVGVPDEETFFVGHSIGCQAILRYLDAYHFEPHKKVGGAVFVAGWFNLENLEDDETRRIARPWIEKPINAEKIRMVLPRLTLIISDDDPYGAASAENQEKFRELGAKIVVLHGAGHITAEDGFIKAPIVLSELTSFL